ncbi:HesA/MoeB/ThiF family protein [Shewanella aestuarii]|uniref:HesA/MoeB/ThiF family protein n=1 Tax=Shewanella aestuarii TaxID=1028752 RepID=UPI001FCBB561|nr:HesA/MoeB/ThiF family protein [Shewanella aestuarii]
MAQYLAASGVGHLHLLDNDKVELSNLPRQILFNANDIGVDKVKVAANKLQQRNQDCQIAAHPIRLTSDNYQALFNQITPQLLFDCCDNFATRQLINRIAIERQIPLFSAAISADEGQWFAYAPLSDDKQAFTTNISPYGCYHCVFPADSQLSQSCSQMGVLGPAVGVMASIQALAGINYIIGRQVEFGVLHRLDAKYLSWSKAKMSLDQQCRVCRKAFISAQ